MKPISKNITNTLINIDNDLYDTIEDKLYQQLNDNFWTLDSKIFDNIHIHISNPIENIFIHIQTNIKTIK